MIFVKEMLNMVLPLFFPFLDGQERKRWSQKRGIKTYKIVNVISKADAHRNYFGLNLATLFNSLINLKCD